VQIAGRAAALARVPAAAQPDPLLVGDPRGNVHLQRLAYRAPAAAATLVARLGRDLPVAPARVARLLAHELAEGGAGHGAQPSGAAAGRARLDRGSRLGAVPVAVLAGVDHL